MCVNGYLESDNYGRWTTYKIKQKVETSNRKVDTSKISTRLSRPELEKLIMSVCLYDYKKMEYVAYSIGKSEDYLKNKIFPQMIKDGKLEKKFPYIHNHPEQAYKTTDKYAEKL